MTGDVDRERLDGLGVLLVSVLRATTTIPRIPNAAKKIVDQLAQDLPPQAASIGRRTRIGEWIRATAVLESQALWEATWDLLTMLRERSASNTARARSQRAFLTARLGRVARVAGNIEDAEFWYREAFALSTRLPLAMRWLDARPHALLGLCVLNVGRGNYPEAAGLARRVVRGSPPGLYLIQAYLVSALISRKRGDPLRALEFLWKAIDRLPSRDGRRTEVLITLAETAADLHQPEAAVRVRLAALARARTPRLAAAALSGLLSLAATQPSENDDWFARCLGESAWGRSLSSKLGVATSRHLLLNATRDWLAGADRFGFSPDDRILMHIGSVRLALSCADLSAVETRNWIQQSLTTIEQLSTKHMFNERLFELDALRQQFAQVVEFTSAATTWGQRRPLAWVASTRPVLHPVGAAGLGSSRAAQRLIASRFSVAMDPRAVLR